MIRGNSSKQIAAKSLFAAGVVLGIVGLTPLQSEATQSVNPPQRNLVAAGLKGEVVQVPGGGEVTRILPRLGEWSTSGALAFDVKSDIRVWTPGQPSSRPVATGELDTWLADGQRLAFWGQGPAPEDVNVVDVTTGAVTHLCQPVEGNWCGGEVLPDGKHLVTDLQTKVDDSWHAQVALFTVQTNGALSRQDVGGTGPNDETNYLGRSQDGSRIALEQRTQTGSHVRLLVMDVGTGQVREVPQRYNARWVQFTGLSPDGVWVTTGTDPDVRDTETGLVNVDTGQDLCLTCSGQHVKHGAGAVGTWSPNSRYFAFTSTTRRLDPAHRDDRLTNLYVYDMKIGRTRLATQPVDPPGRFGGNSEIGQTTDVWSPDSKYLLFDSNSRLVQGDPNNGQNDVYVYNARSGKVALAAATSSGAKPNGETGTPTFSADGKYILFMSDATNLPGPHGGYRMYVKRFTPR